MITLQDIEMAKERIGGHVIRTPLVRLNSLDEIIHCKVFAKLENLQTTGSFKLRGALNRVLSMNAQDLENGIVCASSGNHGRAVAYAASMLGTSATVVVPYSASQTKVEAIRSLGAEIVQCDNAKRFALSERIAQEKHAALIPPFNDDYVMAGQGTVGLEIIEQCPQVNKVIVPVSGGGLLSGVATAIASKCQNVEVIGAEPSALPRYTVSLAADMPLEIPARKTIADALVSFHPGSLCFNHVRAYAKGVVPVSESYIQAGTWELLMRGKILAEISSCIGIGAILEGGIHVNPDDTICLLISGGNTGIDQIKNVLG